MFEAKPGKSHTSAPTLAMMQPSLPKAKLAGPNRSGLRFDEYTILGTANCYGNIPLRNVTLA
jgi:hypothetical protein